MEIKTKFNIGEKVFYTLKSILTVVKTNPFYTDKEIFDSCYREGFVVGIRISFDVIDKKPIIKYIIGEIIGEYIINDENNVDADVDVDADDIEMLECVGAKYDEDLVSNNREELEKTIHDIHIAELKMMNEKIMNLMK